MSLVIPAHVALQRQRNQNYQVNQVNQVEAIDNSPAAVKRRAKQYADELMAAVGDLSDFPIYLNAVLVGIFQREKIGNIILDDKSKERDQFMAKGGLVLKLGPGVDVDDHVVQFHGRKLQVGDWIAFMPADGWPVKIRGQQCRLIADNNIKMGIPSPDVVY